jgi:propanediol dehydratase small subunit
LRLQAEVAQAAGRLTLALNFERAAELTEVPQDVVMRIYELLRPGRAKSKDDLLAAAAELRDRFKATRMAAFVEDAAEVYEKRGLFVQRFQERYLNHAGDVLLPPSALEGEGRSASLPAAVST